MKEKLYGRVSNHISFLVMRMLKADYLVLCERLLNATCVPKCTQQTILAILAWNSTASHVTFSNMQRQNCIMIPSYVKLKNQMAAT
jgi:hypothetical protein